MQGLQGRTALVRRNGTPVAGIRTKSISISGSPIDITTDDDGGVRKLMDLPGQVDVSIQCSGVVLSEALRNEALNASTSRIKPTDFIFGGFEGSPANTHGFSGAFFLASYSESGEHNGVVTFDATFESTGAVTYTPK